MARKRRREEHENHERWLVSYADFITLLFAFFVVMYSVSQVNEGKMRVLSDSLMATFSGRQKSLSPIQVGKLVRSTHTDDISPVTKPVLAPPMPMPAKPKDEPDEGSDPAGSEGGDNGADAKQSKGQDSKIMADVGTIADEVEDAVAALIEDDLVYVRRKDSWLEVEFKTSVLFKSGAARLAAGAIPILEELAVLLTEFPNPIQVEGFTDDVPISTPNFPSNWELSAARAASVVHLFARSGVRPGRMAAIGYGEFRPVADNSTVEGRTKNRRVVLVIPAGGQTRQDLELRRLAGESSASGINTVEPWAEAPSAEY